MQMYTLKMSMLIYTKFMVISVVHLLPQRLVLNRCEECVKYVCKIFYEIIGRLSDRVNDSPLVH